MNTAKGFNRDPLRWKIRLLADPLVQQRNRASEKFLDECRRKGGYIQVLAERGKL